jgi:DNA transposition AAA+ family ATPase
MENIYASDSEAALHEAAIDALASEMRRPAAEIKPYYEREVQRLQAGARIRDFLSVCAARHTREALRIASRSSRPAQND